MGHDVTPARQEAAAAAVCQIIAHYVPEHPDVLAHAATRAAAADLERAREAVSQARTALDNALVLLAGAEAGHTTAREAEAAIPATVSREGYRD